jgi:N6-adenosine-specific RNA methylase IME4
VTVKLVKYDAACKAIAEAKRVDEVKRIRDISIAMKTYARQAGNVELEADAIEIRMRATRRMDQMRQEQKAAVGLAKGGGGKHGRKRVAEKPTLKDAGINKNLAHERRKLGAMTDRQFESSIKAAREATNRVVRDAIKGNSKKQSRQQRELDLGRKQAAMPAKAYGVILADPPWSFKTYSSETGMDRAADNHYPTMGTDAIAALPVPAAPDCVLFLWATVPMLPDALRVLEAWGFWYKSNFVWVKDKDGTGFWSRNRHEFLLIGTKGNIPAPTHGEQYSSVIDVPRGAHSAKPFVVHEMIETMFPTLPRIELFAREKFEGWDSWGNEIAEAAA